MNSEYVRLPLMACVAMTLLATPRLEAQMLTEIHDPLRGVTFHSVELNGESYQSEEIRGPVALRNHQMTIGLSAFMFDESTAIEEYILWLRHDGPGRWFSGTDGLPLRIEAAGKPVNAKPLHWYAPETPANAGSFVEKVEFALDVAELDKMLNAESATLHLETLLGDVSYRLSESDFEAMRRFVQRIRS
jgi:hypothetical protein